MKFTIEHGRVSLLACLSALRNELGASEGTSMFNWYVETYDIDLRSSASIAELNTIIAPETMAYEIFGV